MFHRFGESEKSMATTSLFLKTKLQVVTRKKMTIYTVVQKKRADFGGL